MFDVQRERLKHLLANAILELWKKETGSLSSVLIEGTICITSGSGRTTVVQVADKFTGCIPEADSEEESELRFTPPNFVRSQLMHNGGNYHYAPTVDCHQNQAAVMAAYLDELSPQSLVSPNTDYSNTSRGSRPSSVTEKSRRTQKPTKKSVNNIKEEILSDESSSETDATGDKDASPQTVPGPVCPGTGYYTFEGSENDNSGSTQESEMETSSSFHNNSSGYHDSIDSPLSSTPKYVEKRKSDQTEKDKSGKSAKMSSGSQGVIDLSRKDVDLALSSPQSYTAQVHDVIRQRLLARKGGAQMPVGSESHCNTSTPHMLQSLGLHRSNSDTPNNSSNSWPMANLEKVVIGHSPYGPTPGIKNGVFPNGPIFGSPAVGSAFLPSPFTSLLAKQGQSLSNGPLHDILTTNKRSKSPLWSGDFNGNTSSVNNNNSNNSNTSNASSSGDKVSPASSNNDQKVYRCEFCDKTFLFKSKYHEHLPVHTNARPFQCHLCSRTYKYKYDLRVHLRTHMGIPTKSTICPFCTAKFETNKLVRLHIKECHQDYHRVTEEDCTQPIDNLPPAM